MTLRREQIINAIYKLNQVDEHTEFRKRDSVRRRNAKYEKQIDILETLGVYLNH